MIKIHYIHIWKCHDETQYAQLIYANKNILKDRLDLYKELGYLFPGSDANTKKKDTEGKLLVLICNRDKRLQMHSSAKGQIAFSPSTSEAEAGVSWVCGQSVYTAELHENQSYILRSCLLKKKIKYQNPPFAFRR